MYCVYYSVHCVMGVCVLHSVYCVTVCIVMGVCVLCVLQYVLCDGGVCCMASVCSAMCIV